jgi:acyl-CoA synthetase (AMP-forming)/AMP-acid ligase II
MDTRTLPAAFEQAATWHPDRPAFVQGGSEPERGYTYREGYEAAARFAAALVDAGVESGDRVAFLSRTTVEHAVGYFGTQMAGAIPVTLHIREAAATIADMLDVVTPTVVAFQPRFGDLLATAAERADTLDNASWVAFDRYEADPIPAFAVPYSVFVEAPSDAASDAVDSVTVGPDDVAFVNFSSGTTGTPKGVVHTHEEAVEGAHLGQYKMRVRGGERYLVQATPSFIGWSMLLYPVVNTAATGVFLERWSPEAVLSATEAHELDLLLLVSTQWRRVLDADVEAYDVSSVRHAIYTGEPISLDRLTDIRERVCEQVYTVYSSTEALNAGTVLFPEAVDESTLGTVGKPVTNVDLRLVEPDSKDPEAVVEHGEVGEIIMRGPPVAERLWAPVGGTDILFHEDGWWFSGDLGRLDSDRNLVLEGRADNMIVSGGINVYPEGVERELERHPDVREALVVGVNDEQWGQAVKAYLVAREDLTRETVEEWCRANDSLANYQRPRYYEFVSSLPRTASGKLDRSGVDGA